MRWSWTSYAERKAQRRRTKIGRLEEKAEQLRKGDSWFAWIPVWVNKPNEPRQYLWLEWVLRRYIDAKVSVYHTFLFERSKTVLRYGKPYYKTMDQAFNERLNLDQQKDSNAEGYTSLSIGSRGGGGGGSSMYIVTDELGRELIKFKWP